MDQRGSIRAIPRLAMTGLTLVALVATSSKGQDYGEPVGDVPRIAQSPQSFVRPGVPIPGQPGAVSPYGTPIPEQPGAAPSEVPGEVGPYGLPSLPQPGVGAPSPSPMTMPTSPLSTASPFGSAFQPAFTPEQFAAGGGQTFAVADNVGYIDSAIIRSRIRVRYDSAYDLNRPDRAEFFYPKCGCFNTLTTLQNAPQFFDPNARGPKHAVPTRLTPNGPLITSPFESRVDYQQVSPYLEYAANQRFSVFAELPVRFLNPTLNANANGFSDLNLGFKYAFIANPNQFYTFQFRTYAPTGDADRGLGTGHPSVEPGLLVFQRLTERLYFSGEFLDWIPIRGSNYAGNVLIYGAGLSYNIILSDHVRVAPVNEFVGWTILSGKQSNPGDPFSAAGMAAKAGTVDVAGATIVNYKIGLRFGLGNYRQAGGGSALNDRHSFYIGYGRAITGDHWYRDMFRLEYNLWF